MANKIVLGILAHVDAGKTTLAETMLFHTGMIRQMGRVDHRNTFLDTNEMERARGITIFSKQALLSIGDFEITLLDTPGHADFSAEMERTLQVLDYAILVISASDGVQAHTQTLWKLLHRYEIPTFIFVNKMDLPGGNKESVLSLLKERLGEECVDFSLDHDTSEWQEQIAVCDEAVLEQYMNGKSISDMQTVELISQRKLFPCYFGSALKSDGVCEMILDLGKRLCGKVYPQDFGARIFKITRDEQGNRLTHMKITGGRLNIKKLITYECGQNHMNPRAGEVADEQIEEKVDQIRVYSGVRYEMIQEVEAGGVCAVTGLSHTIPGQGLGMEKEEKHPILEPVLHYAIHLPQGCDALQFMDKLRQLEEEDPQLRIIWSQRYQEIWIQLMGDVQLETLQNMIKSRFGVVVEFGEGAILYKETIECTVIGAGHYEPLRHYAEVHLLVEPDESGSGITVMSSCSEEQLDKNWQKQVMTYLREKELTGVLTGSPVTDMKITLVAGRAHLKHTEGGDFRQAAHRAFRQGLMKTKSILLEPIYEFRLELPTDAVGRAMSDITRMYGQSELLENTQSGAILTGTAPVSTMRGYQKEVTAYTKGQGRLFCNLNGYAPCHNQDEIVKTLGYDPETDFENPSGSVFCAHGAGYVVPWQQAEEMMHTEYAEGKKLYDPIQNTDLPILQNTNPDRHTETVKRKVKDSWSSQKELEEIFERTFGPIKNRSIQTTGGFGHEQNRQVTGNRQESTGRDENKQVHKRTDQKEYLLVDGYNIIFAWEELSSLAALNLDAARQKLMDILCNYQGYRQCILILVFDAYKVKGNIGEKQEYHNIHVVYTKEAETADAYIEKTTHEIAKQNKVVVATSDGMEQMIILGHGATRLSAQGLKEEVIKTNEMIRQDIDEQKTKGKVYLGDHMNETLLNEFNKTQQ
ncbi:MAG: TetM/TetW/TetO/TetS family tetracycline resistance ribosomal protection protein [Lachnospiraceae bacterium]|nr:TetM/TetW/TetO/TetS family tetracycline resistance ribosomal protection protein [Lachnospiraceae bacterium]